MKRIRALALCMGMLAAPAMAVLDSGMALICLDGDGGKLVVRYLSTDRQVTVVGGNVKHACLSPDGKKVAYMRTDVTTLHTVNIDGTNDQQIATAIGGARGTPQWCTDGYIYWEKGKLFRVPETGGPNEDLIGEWRTDVTSPTGAVLGGGQHAFNEMQMDRAGTRAVGTAPKEGGGYGQRAYDLIAKEEYFFVLPCQEGISPSGEIVSVSYAGHRFYRFVPWRVTFADYGDDGNTCDGCKLPGLVPGECPEYDTAVSIADDIQALFSPDSRVNNIGDPRFSDHEEDIFLFKVSPGNGATEAVACYAYNLTNHEYTRLYSGSSTCWGFIREEITMDTQQPYTLAPSTATFTVESGGALPPNQTLTLTSTQAMGSSPTVTGTPAWLNVDATRVDDYEYTLSLSLVQSEIPGEGTYDATLSVTPGGSGSALSVDVTLSVVPPPPPPIVIHSPTDGASFALGDTMRITYSADPTLVTGVVIKLTVDGGEGLTQINDNDALPAGDNLTFEYVITDPLMVLGTPTTHVSNDCFIQLSDYPEGSETFSPTFAITAGSSASHSKAGSDWTQARLRVTSVLTAEGSACLRILSPQRGSAALYDIAGRLQRQFAVKKGGQTLSLGGNVHGSLLLRVSYAGGRTESVVVYLH
ncbi:MAG: hypothetical protein GF331_15120 [Chitinivibrionales bacterium]|nr:hypothetical protein [Chitinivibrionales bacterium]